MKSQPQLSIIIVSYNTKKLTLSCVKSIYASKPQVKFDVWVVENGSDGTYEALEKKKYKNLHLLKSKRNSFAYANNRALKKSKGAYKLLLNSDTQVEKGAIDKLYEYARMANAEVGAVVPRLLNTDGTTQASLFRLPNFLRTVRQYWLGERTVLSKYSLLGSGPHEVEAAVMAAFLITPRAIEKIGYLDDEYVLYFEDLEYCRRMHFAGLKIHYVPRITVIHHHGQSGKSIANEENQWKRLIPGAKRYHGYIEYWMVFFVMKTSQIIRKLVGGTIKS